MPALGDWPRVHWVEGTALWVTGLGLLGLLEQRSVTDFVAGRGTGFWGLRLGSRGSGAGRGGGVKTERMATNL